MQVMYAFNLAAFPLAAGAIPPIVVLVLCIIAGIGTVLLLPGPREKSVRAIGGVVLLAVLLVFVAMLVRQSAQHGAGDVYFWLFSIIAIVSSVRVISHERPVYAALYFVLTVVASAGLFVLLWAEFMAAALILIYAGAILVTYVFVIMLAQQAQTSGTEQRGADYDIRSREPVVACAVGFTLLGVLLFLIFDKSGGIAPAAGPQTAADTAGNSIASMHALGRYLFTDQMVALEIAGVILTLSMVGAVISARKQVAGEGPLHGDVLAGGGSGGEVTTFAVPKGPDDNPHTIPIVGTENPTAKAYPER